MVEVLHSTQSGVEKLQERELCPKCHNRDVALSWLPEGAQSCVHGERPYFEHVAVTCEHCGYSWARLPLDAA